MSNKPLISVIVPVYNTENYIRDCLDSILTQTYTNLEVIVIDDGSKDKSEEIIQEYIAKDNRVKYFKQENSGLSATRNKGMDIAQGEFISFIDSDDAINKYFYETLYDALITTNVSIAECKLKNFLNIEELNDIRNSQEYKILNYYNFIESPIIQGSFGESSCTKLYKSEFIKTFRFDIGKIFEDSRIIHKMYCKAENIVFVDFEGYYYRKSPNSITRSKINEKQLELLDVIENRIEFFRELKWHNHIKYCMADYARRALIFYSECVRQKVDKNLKNKPYDILMAHKNEFLNNLYNHTKTKMMLRVFYFSPKLFSFIYIMLKK